VLPSYTFSVAVSRWRLDVPVLVAVLAAGAVYLAGATMARRRGVAWPWWRTACFLVLGLGSLVVCTMSSLAVYQHEHLWALGAQVTLLTSIVPVCLAVGDPIGLLRAALPPAGADAVNRALAGRVVRVLTFPLVAAVLTTAGMVTFFFSPLLEASLRHALALHLVYAAALLLGCLTALPLLGAEILPAWCTPPIKALFGFFDGLVDALPGVLVMTTPVTLAGGYFAKADGTHGHNWDVHVAGALVLALSEVVALPLFFMLFFQWAASETRREPAPRRAASDAATTQSGPAAPEPEPEPELMRPWWETEGYGPRNRR
jgi:putative copper resistance protein D